MNLLPGNRNPQALKGWRYNLRFALAALKNERDQAKLPEADQSPYGAQTIAQSVKNNRAMIERLWSKRHLGAGMGKHYK